VRSGYKLYTSINNSCDLYINENYIVIIRRQNLWFVFYFLPMVISNEVKAITINGDKKFVANKPDKILIREYKSGEVIIYLSDSTYNQRKIELILRGLTIEQLSYLEIIKSWI
jgi:hypothetical protein